MKTGPERYLEELAEVATIRDKAAFSARLAEIIDREVEQALEHQPQEGSPTETPDLSFRAEKRWEPSATELQRGRVLMLKEFRKPHNLPVAEFALLAGKSRQQIYKDVEMRRLLALSIGARGQRIPDWQLDETSKRLTQALLDKARGVDEWTLYYALSEPSEALSGKAPINVVTAGNMERILAAVLGKLDIRA
jgi:hypothetical protein